MKMSSEAARKAANESLASDNNTSVREFYERPEDIANEAKVAKMVEAARNCQTQKLPRAYPADYAALQLVDDPNNPGAKVPTVRFWFEIKRRRRNYDTYPTLFISLHKWMALLDLSRSIHRPCYFLALFNDGSVYFCQISKTPAEANYDVTIGGRSGRLDANGKFKFDPQDIEPVVHVPMEHFYKLRGPTILHKSVQQLYEANA